MILDVAPYSKKQHGKWLRGMVGSHAGYWFYRGASRDNLIGWVEAELRKDDCRAIVAHPPGDIETVVGFAAVRPGRIVFAGVRHDKLGLSVRRKGVARMLLGRLGVRPEVPHALTIWTPDATRVAAAGHWRLYPALPEPKRKDGENEQ